MPRWIPWVALVTTGCSPPPPNLLERFVGAWVGDLVPDDGDRRGLEGAFELDPELGDLVGELVVEELDGPRAFSVQSSESIETLGIALYFVETTGVRELWTEAEPPSDGFWTGPYRTSTWGCEPDSPDDPDGDGLCSHEGTLQLSAR